MVPHLEGNAQTMVPKMCIGTATWDTNLIVEIAATFPCLEHQHISHYKMSDYGMSCHSNLMMIKGNNILMNQSRQDELCVCCIWSTLLRTSSKTNQSFKKNPRKCIRDIHIQYRISFFKQWWRLLRKGFNKDLSISIKR